MEKIAGLYQEDGSFSWIERGPFDSELEAVRSLSELVAERKTGTGYAYPSIPKIKAIKVVRRGFNKWTGTWIDRDVLYYQELK